MVKMSQKAVKPIKLNDTDLFSLIGESIAGGNYVFTKHARQRSGQRKILEITVLGILEGKTGRKRRRNKRKDRYEIGAFDWNYCVEGVDLKNERVRIIITFEVNLMPIITVMWI